jgi:hypothetical protein
MNFNIIIPQAPSTKRLGAVLFRVSEGPAFKLYPTIRYTPQLCAGDYVEKQWNSTTVTSTLIIKYYKIKQPKLCAL